MRGKKSMTRMDQDPPYESSRIKKIDKRPPWQLLAFFGLALLIIIGFFSWFWRVQDEVYLTQPYDETPTGYTPTELDTAPPAIVADAEVTIKVTSVPEGEVIEVLPTVAPLTYVGNFVQVRGEVDQILSPAAFVLRQVTDGTTRGVDIIVIHLPEDVANGELSEESLALVQGQLVRFSVDALASFVGADHQSQELEKFEGMPAVVTTSIDVVGSH